MTSSSSSSSSTLIPSSATTDVIVIRVMPESSRERVASDDEMRKLFDEATAFSHDREYEDIFAAIKLRDEPLVTKICEDPLLFKGMMIKCTSLENANGEAKRWYDILVKNEMLVRATQDEKMTHLITNADDVQRIIVAMDVCQHEHGFTFDSCFGEVTVTAGDEPHHTIQPSRRRAVKYK